VCTAPKARGDGAFLSRAGRCLRGQDSRPAGEPSRDRGIGNVATRGARGFSGSASKGMLSAWAAFLVLSGCAEGVSASASPTRGVPHTPAQATLSSIPPTPPSTPVSAASSPGSCASVEPWSIHLQVSGGFAGVSRALEMSSGGDLSVRDLQDGHLIQRQLTPQEAAEMADLLTAICGLPTGGRPAVCPDCFAYDYEFLIGQRSLTGRATDVSLQGSPLAPLISHLTQLISDSLLPPAEESGE
jgi:hypothetical protein